MPRGKHLSEVEKAKIEAYHDQGLSNRNIAEKIFRSRTVINNYINLGENYGAIERPGRKTAITTRVKQAIKRLAVKENLFADEIRKEMKLGIGQRRVQQILKKELNLKFDKRYAKPELKPGDKLARLRFAEKYRFWREEWKTVIFSDEKKFNLDGPDGSQKYWRDKNTLKESRKSRNFGGGSLMVWGGIGFSGRTPICFVTTRMNSEYYIELLDEVLICFGEEVACEEFIFQHDNASIHNSKKTKEFLHSRNIPLLDWPSRSPDLNPIENLWSILAYKVFLHGRQYSDIMELKEAVNTEWKNIDVGIIQNLINSMPKRLEDVITNNGGHTSY